MFEKETLDRMSAELGKGINEDLDGMIAEKDKILKSPFFGEYLPVIKHEFEKLLEGRNFGLSQMNIERIEAVIKELETLISNQTKS